MDQSHQKWKVFFDGSFWGHRGSGRAGTEINIGRQFDWAGHHWLIPAAYSCGKGLVVDFCMQVDAEKIRAFIRKWDLNRENDSCENFTEEQQMEPERDNHKEAKRVVDHYALDVSCGWVIYRKAFPWESKRRPEIKTLSLTMEQQPEIIPGFSVPAAMP